MSVGQKEIYDLERKIADGTVPRCPLCGERIVVGKKQEGASGAIGFQYRCINRACHLPPGHAHMPWHIVLFRALQKRTVQLTIAAIGSITITAALAFATGLINWKSTNEAAISQSGNTSDFQAYLQQLINTADNNFEKNQIEEILRQYKQITTESHVDSLRGRENVFMMARAADAANISIQGIGAFSPDAWGKELNPYLLANQRAAERGVEVKRIFILPQNLDEAGITKFLSVMQQQINLGIKVHYAFQDQIQLIPYYRDNPFSPCALFDGKYFGYDLRTDIMSGNFPDATRITWDKDEIREKSPFPDIFRSRYVFQFNEQAERIIKEHYQIPQ
jgi:hypothetical protein